jgi:hypothetical protein
MRAAGSCRRVVFGAFAMTAVMVFTASYGAGEFTLDRSPAVYGPHEQPRVQFGPPGESPLLIVDWQGTERGRLAASAASGELALPALPPGYYELVAGAGANAPRRAFAVLAEAIPPSRTFGVMTHFAQGWNLDIVPSIARAGIGTVRDEQYWQQVEPQAGSYADPPYYARYMAALRQAQIEPLLVLSFANVNYDSGKTPFTPAGRAAFAAYGAEVSRRYREQVHAVEVWNEVNGSFCSGPCVLDRAGTYSALLEDSYAALKRAQPDLTVIGGAAVKVPMPWFDALIAHGAARHWDAVAVHPYRGDPEGARRDIDDLHARLRAAGSAAPIWVTEFGTGAGTRSAADRVATAAYLVRMAVVLRAAGVERMYWYLLRDYAEFQGMGLLRADTDPLGRYAPTPAYPAYATLIRLLDGATGVAREPTDPRTYVYRFERDGKRTYALWAPDGPLAARVTLPAGGELVDMVGGTRTLEAGTSALTLDAHPQYLRGNVARIEAPRPDTLLADAAEDFDVDKPSTTWSYGTYLMPAPADPGHLCGTPAAAPEPLRKRASPWEYFFGDPRWPVLRVGIDTQHPARTEKGAAWSVRTYHSAAAGPLRVSGAFARQGQGDGSGGCILVNGKAVFEQLLAPGPNRRAPFDLTVQVPADARIDFVVTPGPRLDITDDAVAVQARVSRPAVSP